MKLHWFASLLLLFLLLLGAGVRTANPPLRPASTNAPGTNVVVITCTNGVQVTTNHVIFRSDVKAQDSQMYLECELLTAWYSSKSTNAPKPAAGGSTVNSDSSDIDLIVAETNVMMITAE